MSNLYIGLMSGTSLDGIDAALVDFTESKPRLIDFQTLPYTPELRVELEQLCQPSNDEISLLGRADRALGEAFAQATRRLLQQNFLVPEQIRAIGSHGQTIRHTPHGEHAFSLQIGDPNTLAALSSIDVVADFRRKDVALGGQGAPLVPAFHQTVFTQRTSNTVVVNIGGIANITFLPLAGQSGITGFDTGPGNTLLDAWCYRHCGLAYDNKGEWAAQGKVDKALLESLLAHPYFSQAAPKSTGREMFNLEWLDHVLSTQTHLVSPENVQATLVQLSAQSIVLGIAQFENVEHVYVCGGGVQNEFLMECLESVLHECEFNTTDSLGINADAVEAIAFAWLAYAFIHNVPGNVPSVTGASRAAVLGTLCPRLI